MSCLIIVFNYIDIQETDILLANILYIKHIDAHKDCVICRFQTQHHEIDNYFQRNKWKPTNSIVFRRGVTVGVWHGCTSTTGHDKDEIQFGNDVSQFHKVLYDSSYRSPTAVPYNIQGTSYFKLGRSFSFLRADRISNLPPCFFCILDSILSTIVIS